MHRVFEWIFLGLAEEKYADREDNNYCNCSREIPQRDVFTLRVSQISHDSAEDKRTSEHHNDDGTRREARVVRKLYADEADDRSCDPTDRKPCTQLLGE